MRITDNGRIIRDELSEPKTCSTIRPAWDLFAESGELVGQGRHRSTFVLEDGVAKFPFGWQQCPAGSSRASDLEVSNYEGGYPFPVAKLISRIDIPVQRESCTGYINTTFGLMPCRCNGTDTLTVLITETVKVLVTPEMYHSGEANSVITRLRREFRWFDNAMASRAIDCGQVGLNSEGDLVVFDFADPCANKR